MKHLLLILVSLVFFSYLPAQVGINNPSPSQALDVAGKIKVGNDDTAPEAGTIRYNRSTNTFEGFDGTEWSVFNADPDGGNNGGGNVPASGAVVMSRFSSGFESQVGWVEVGGDGTNYFIIPPGRTLYVTSIIVSSTGGYQVSLKPQHPSGNGSLSYQNLFLKAGSGDQISTLHDANGHLLIIPSGSALQIDPHGSSVWIQLRGFFQ